MIVAGLPSTAWIERSRAAIRGESWGARHATINVNTVEGGQSRQDVQTPCVADRCRAVFDRRFLLEEGFAAAKDEVEALIRRAGAAAPGIELSLIHI